MKPQIPVVNLHCSLVYPASERIVELSVAEGSSSLSLDNSSQSFGLADEQQLLFDDTIQVYHGKAYLRFRPTKFGIYQTVIKGYNGNQEELIRYQCVGYYRRSFKNALVLSCLSLVVLSTLFLFRFRKVRANATPSGLVVQPIDIRVMPHDTFYVGSTETYIDPLMLNVRMSWANKITIDCEKYGHKSLKELYQLLNQRKIDAIVSNSPAADTLSILWSIPYTYDDLRLGLPRTKHNVMIIQKFNHL